MYSWEPGTCCDALHKVGEGIVVFFGFVQQVKQGQNEVSLRVVGRQVREVNRDAFRSTV